MTPSPNQTNAPRKAEANRSWFGPPRCGRKVEVIYGVPVADSGLVRPIRSA
jgi:hypothetical protein